MNQLTRNVIGMNMSATIASGTLSRNITTAIAMMENTLIRKYGRPSMKNPETSSESDMTRVIREPVCLLVKKLMESLPIAPNTSFRMLLTTLGTIFAVMTPCRMPTSCIVIFVITIVSTIRNRITI